MVLHNSNLREYFISWNTKQMCEYERELVS